MYQKLSPFFFLLLRKYSLLVCAQADIMRFLRASHLILIHIQIHGYVNTHMHLKSAHFFRFYSFLEQKFYEYIVLLLRMLPYNKKRLPKIHCLIIHGSSVLILQLTVQLSKSLSAIPVQVHVLVPVLILLQLVIITWSIYAILATVAACGREKEV